VALLTMARMSLAPVPCTALPAFLQRPADAAIEGEVIRVKCYAPPHCLPDLRLRHPVQLYCTRYDDADTVVTRRVRGDWSAASSRFPEIARHQGDLVHSRIYYRELAAPVRSGRPPRPRLSSP